MKKPILNQYERQEIIQNTGSYLNEVLLLKIELYKCFREISREVPDWLMSIAYKYRIPTIFFYILSIFMIYKEEYFSAVIAVIIGMLIKWRLKWIQLHNA